MNVFIHMYNPYTKWRLVQNVLLQCMVGSQDNVPNVQMGTCTKRTNYETVQPKPRLAYVHHYCSKSSTLVHIVQKWGSELSPVIVNLWHASPHSASKFLKSLDLTAIYTSNLSTCKYNSFNNSNVNPNTRFRNIQVFKNHANKHW